MNFSFFKKSVVGLFSLIIFVSVSMSSCIFAGSSYEKTNCFVGNNFYSISDSDKTAEFIKSELSKVDIPNEIEYKEKKYKVTSISDNAFRNRTDLTDVKIPDSVKKIGSYAFYGCWRLSKISIPASVISIGDYAFWNCSAPSQIELKGNSLESIGNYAFADCYSVDNIEFPDSLKKIGSDAFKKCNSLSSIKISGLFDRHKFDKSGIELCKDKNDNYNLKFKVSGSTQEGQIKSKDGTDVQCVCNTGKETTIIDLQVNKWIV